MSYKNGCPVGTLSRLNNTNDGKHRFTRTHTGSKIKTDKHGRYKEITETCKLCGEARKLRMYVGLLI
tara:strand:- start:135 stop:335 length:201 start_codon:yes stop_codon:yes gene_type:complete